MQVREQPDRLAQLKNPKTIHFLNGFSSAMAPALRGAPGTSEKTAIGAIAPPHARPPVQRRRPEAPARRRNRRTWECVSPAIHPGARTTLSPQPKAFAASDVRIRPTAESDGALAVRSRLRARRASSGGLGASRAPRPRSQNPLPRAPPTRAPPSDHSFCSFNQAVPTRC